jgi:hypothetical protein
MAQNETLARHMNEAIEREAGEEPGAAHQFLCECAQTSCTSTLNIRPGAYMRVRTQPRRFIVLPGHEDPEIEQTVETHDGYVVIEKLGDAGAVAEADQPETS